jgi:hypothetical protein
LTRGKGFSALPAQKQHLRRVRRRFRAVRAAGLSLLTVNVGPKSFIIQGFDDFCGVLDADLRLPLR